MWVVKISSVFKYLGGYICYNKKNIFIYKKKKTNHNRHFIIGYKFQKKCLRNAKCELLFIEMVDYSCSETE